MRSPRVIYGVVAGLLVAAGFLLPRYLAERSSPELGGTVVVPAGSSTTPTPAPTATPTKPTATSTTGAEPVSPPPARTAGPDDDDDLVDDPDDDDG
ncbi:MULTISPECIES: hypothetical protein [unclassified Kribbella]|uniref:hypothetical protein n=1 Tax=unclassified Kribbella TaxID=2644121 RepID=UPI00301B4DDA